VPAIAVLLLLAYKNITSSDEPSRKHQITAGFRGHSQNVGSWYGTCLTSSFWSL